MEAYEQGKCDQVFTVLGNNCVGDFSFLQWRGIGRRGMSRMIGSAIKAASCGSCFPLPQAFTLSVCLEASGIVFHGQRMNFQ